MQGREKGKREENVMGEAEERNPTAGRGGKRVQMSGRCKRMCVCNRGSRGDLICRKEEEEFDGRISVVNLTSDFALPSSKRGKT